MSETCRKREVDHGSGDAITDLFVKGVSLRNEGVALDGGGRRSDAFRFDGFGRLPEELASFARAKAASSSSVTEGAGRESLRRFGSGSNDDDPS